MNADMLDFERRKTSHSILPPDFCPICKRTGDPEYICGREIGIQELIFRDYVTPLQTVFRCRSRECRNMFFAFYNSSTNGAINKHIFLSPVGVKGKNFGDDALALKDKLNTKFFEIYNQSEKAESSGLFEIYGMGYRKALEFLVKDYVSYLHPEDRDKIQSSNMLLGKCISIYLKDSSVGNFSELAAWYGNDETHTQKIHNATIDDLKKLINYVVQTIILDINLDKTKEYVKAHKDKNKMEKEIK